MNPLLRYDRRLIKGHRCLLGVDEAGRGALAGPVVAAVACLREDFYKCPKCRRNSEGINDSKTLSEEEREEFFSRIERLKNEGMLLAEPGVASVEEIEIHNILGATRLAMRRALEALEKNSRQLVTLPRIGEPDPLFAGGAGENEKVPLLIVIDGKPLRRFPYRHEAIVKGDGKSLAIAMASIVAKVTRDRMMRKLHDEHPVYGFARHKGYATLSHRTVIVEQGPSPVHRPTFLRKILEKASHPAQAGLGLE